MLYFELLTVRSEEPKKALLVTYKIGYLLQYAREATQS